MNVGANTVPVDLASGRTVPVEVIPGEPEGTYVLKSDPEVTAYVPLQTLEDGRVEIDGEVDSLEYSGGKKKSGGLLGRLFR